MKRSGPKADRLKEMAETLAALDESARTRLLANVAREDPALALALEGHFFGFEKIAGLLPEHLRVVVGECAGFRDWPVALRGADEGFWAALAKAMTARALAALRDEVAGLGPQPKAAVDEARAAIVAVARRLADEGRITLRPDEYTAA